MACQNIKQPWELAASDLCLLLRELHVVKDAEDDSEEVVPPVLLERVTVTLHDFKHDCETSVRSKHKHQTHTCGYSTALQPVSDQQHCNMSQRLLSTVLMSSIQPMSWYFLFSPRAWLIKALTLSSKSCINSKCLNGQSENSVVIIGATVRNS